MDSSYVNHPRYWDPNNEEYQNREARIDFEERLRQARIAKEKAAKQTNVACDSCGKTIEVEEEIFRTVARYLLDGIVCDATNEEGDFLSSPCFFHLECWEELTSGLQEIVEDEPPQLIDPDECKCTFCGSSVLCWEHFLHAHIGEIQLSSRSPDNQKSFQFIRIDRNGGSIMCMSCVAHVHEDVVDVWGDVSQQGECDNCAHDRCWREMSCECTCHLER